MAVDKELNKQILVTFPVEMVEQIEEYWHNEKLSNRNEAIRELVRKGLTQTKKASR